MTPAARIQAQIEVLDLIEAGQRPAERVLDTYTRARRYMGSKDRRALSDGVFSVLRQRARLSWWRARAGAATPKAGGRDLTIAALSLTQGAARAGGLFDGAGYGPPTFDDHELALALALDGHDLVHAEQDAAVRLELPAWLAPRLEEAFGSGLEAEMTALNGAAPLDLRVNTLKSDREAVRGALARAGIEAEPIPFLPLGLRAAARAPVRNTQAYRDGWVEIQDAGSQIAAMICDAQPGMAVADICAGAGGKTLALAAAMENRGKLLALDVNRARLDRADLRLRRAGASLVERRVLEDKEDLKDLAGTFERVLVDAPCSGSGAWRRDPQARWLLTAERLAHLGAAQTEILDRASALVRPGGRLIYVTCSLLPEENERQVEAFLKRRANFTLRPALRVWPETLGAQDSADVEPGFLGECLHLTPARTGTDGFFVAILDRGTAP